MKLISLKEKNLINFSIKKVVCNLYLKPGKNSLQYSLVVRKKSSYQSLQRSELKGLDLVKSFS